jgi:hypothetical protein
MQTQLQLRSIIDDANIPSRNTIITVPKNSSHPIQGFCLICSVRGLICYVLYSVFKLCFRNIRFVTINSFGILIHWTHVYGNISDIHFKLYRNQLVSFFILDFNHAGTGLSGSGTLAYGTLERLLASPWGVSRWQSQHNLSLRH